MNLQLDHFSDEKKQQHNSEKEERGFSLSFCPSHRKNPTTKLCRFTRCVCVCVSHTHGTLVEHGPHNVSRWMTWLPISLKNAAKCDNWYQLQNHSITEFLNAKGAREKPFKAIPVHAVSLSVEQQILASGFSLKRKTSAAGKKKCKRVFSAWEFGVLSKHTPHPGASVGAARQNPHN